MQNLRDDPLTRQNVSMGVTQGLKNACRIACSPYRGCHPLTALHMRLPMCYQLDSGIFMFTCQVMLMRQLEKCCAAGLMGA